MVKIREVDSEGRSSFREGILASSMGQTVSSPFPTQPPFTTEAIAEFQKMYDKALTDSWRTLDLKMPRTEEESAAIKVALGEKPTNPKDAIGSGKFPLHLWPATATALGSLAMLDGALKYGRSNFRAIGVRASIYVDAANRHISAWFEGEELDPDSGVPHLAHALACLAILVDAQAAGKLNDDRMVNGNYREFLGTLLPHVARLKKLHEGKTPQHYTIKDNV